jgi:PAS domain S-box-containing protein
MEKMYGWTKPEALGKISHELLGTEFEQPMESIRTFLMEQGHWEGELVHKRKDGARIVVASQWVLHKDERGRPTAILEINNDITERKLAEKEVVRMNAALEQRVLERTAELTAANRELEAFTYSVAHDLRAPLRHIDAFTRILNEDFAENLPAEARRYLENIRRGSQNMSQLVDDLLNLARVGRQEVKRQATALRPLVEDVVKEFRNETEGRHVEWHIQPLPTVRGDAGLLRQVFANLLSNAIKYTRPRSVAVIEVGHVNVDGDIALFVRDNGVGFNMRYADKLFGVFQRLHRAEDFEGTGVGLATVERIIRKHGGHVWAEAAEGKGATFYFTLGAGAAIETETAKTR